MKALPFGYPREDSCQRAWAYEVTKVSIARSRVLKRYRTVLRVLSRYGFSVLAERFGGDGAEGRGERLRYALEELGPTFVKLGQMLSVRSDLLPPDVVAALERLQDQVTPVPFGQVAEVLEAELGSPLGEKFREVEPEAVAAASLGQVHRAVLHDGRKVVVKVQRPGVAGQVDLDLHVLKGLARLASRRTRWGRNYDLPAVAAEFAAMLRAELDYRAEGRSAERFRKNFAGDPEVSFPAVHWEYTTSRVLTLERVGGFRVTDRPALEQASIPPAVVAQRLAGAIFRMVLRDGFFHADPHPGNLFVGPNGAIIFVDFGMVGDLTPAMRANVVDYVVGVVTQDADRVVEAILRMGMIHRPGGRTALRREIVRLQQKYGEVPLRQVQFSQALTETLAAARRFEISFPTGYTVLLKAMTTLEAVARQIDPDATLVGLAAPYAELLIQEGLQPKRLLFELGRDLAQASRHVVRIPGQVGHLLSLLEEGEFRMSLDHAGLDPGLARLSAIANRLAIAILLASLIIGTALIASTGKDSFLQRYPIADVGFLLIGAVGVWLVVSILRSSHS